MSIPKCDECCDREAGRCEDYISDPPRMSAKNVRQVRRRSFQFDLVWFRLHTRDRTCPTDRPPPGITTHPSEPGLHHIEQYRLYRRAPQETTGQDISRYPQPNGDRLSADHHGIRSLYRIDRDG